MFEKNCCDGIYNSFDVHFTSACDNKCEHCIDMRYNGCGVEKPNVGAIVKTIIEEQEGLDDVLFLGGEPCLYLEELLDCIKQLREKTQLKLFVTTAVPKICYDKRNMFGELVSILDGINLSVQHNNEKIADKIRRTTSKYDRQKFYNSLPYKDKIRINLNIVKPILCTREQVVECLQHYDKMGFNSIKLSEIQHGEKYYTSFEEVFGLDLGSPYFNGCQTYLEESVIAGVKTPVLLKRSCFLCEDTLKATLFDGIKVVSKLFSKSKNKYGVVYGNGELKGGWV